jgi:putative phosphoribosyl transferase
MRPAGFHPLFRDRAEAGRRLAERLLPYRTQAPLIVGLPRGGVVVAAEVARGLGASLDVLVVRKVGHPRQPEFGVGAVAPGVVLLDDDAAARFDVARPELDVVVARERAEMERRLRLYRGDAPPLDVRGRTVLLIDDGLATGVTARAAARALRAAGARRIVLAVPVGPASAEEDLKPDLDEVVVLEAPRRFGAVGVWYQSFEQTTDQEVLGLLARHHPTTAAPPAKLQKTSPPPPPSPVRPTHPAHVLVDADGVQLHGLLQVPPAARGAVAFAHGSGSGLASPRNERVAAVLEGRGLATLRLDLLTTEEAQEDERDRRHRFDIELLARRTLGAVGWLERQASTRALPVGLFGASTGAAAALQAAARRPEAVHAVVSRGGRVDLADRIERGRAPVLLIVGGRDEPVLRANEDALTRLRTVKELVVVAGAGHLFEEPGALDQVARDAGEWFRVHLGRVGSDAPAGWGTGA